MHKLLNFFRRLKPRSLQREPADTRGESTVDAQATASSYQGSGAPPGYVPPADEGRPRA